MNLSEKNNQLIQEVDAYKDEINEWSESKKSQVERFYKVRQRLAERQIKNQNRKFNRDLESWKKNVTNLEATYEELLRLRKPAEYWAKSARKFGFQGLGFSVLIIIFVIVGLYYFDDFFEAWLKGQKLNIELSTLQGVVIFGTIIAIYAFLIKVFSRLAFSCFHLMRDSEEREQLTYLYLSLSEDSDVDIEARNIVLQALFSRSETGLLTQEHGPAMPGVAEAIRHATKSKP